MNGRTVIYLGSIALFIGCSVTISHIIHEVELILAGIVVFCVGFTASQMKISNAEKTEHFPNVWQSLGMTLFLIMCIAGVSPLKRELDQLIGKGTATLISYLLYAGIPLLAICSGYGDGNFQWLDLF